MESKLIYVRKEYINDSKSLKDKSGLKLIFEVDVNCNNIPDDVDFVEYHFIPKKFIAKNKIIKTIEEEKNTNA